MKVGLIRCQQTEDMCPASTCFKMMREKQGSFEGVEEEIEIVAANSCGGCPGKKASTRAAEMVARGVDTIVLASCIKIGTPIGYACPFAKKMKDTIENMVGSEIKIIDYTH